MQQNNKNTPQVLVNTVMATEKKRNMKTSEFGPEEDCGCVFRGQRQMVLVKSRSVAVLVLFCFESLSIKNGNKKGNVHRAKIYIGAREDSEESFHKTHLC